jgi:hypothetical protein
MKTTELSKLPIGFQESIIERSKIKSAITNCKSFIKYAKTCNKYYQETKEKEWIEIGQNSLIPYYNQLLSVQYLTNKYHLLFNEEYYKTKHIAEKLLNI